MEKSISHNKKRNVALICEFFIRYVSKCLIDEDFHEAERAVEVFDRNFHDDSLIKQELRIVSAITDTNIKTKEAAYRILSEIKGAVSKVNFKRVEKEKSKLIKEINYSFGPSFYNERVDNYDKFASIHNLLNEYRGNGSINNKAHIVKFEEDVVEYLLKEDKVASKFEVSNKDVYNNVVISVMKKKFFEKYNNKLNDVQIRLLAAKTGILNDSIENVVVESKIEIRKALNVLKESNDILESDITMKAINEVEGYFDNNDMKIGSEQCVKCWLNAAEFINEANK
jgi:hypothetical protein